MSTNKDNYNLKAIEDKWQDRWEKEKLYVTDIKEGKNPFFNLWMFPYPSAEGLHAGHAFASTGSDIYGRFMRMNGNSVFQPIGYDAFGIHSENYAIKIGENPHDVVKRTTKHYEEQMRSLGHGYDWTRTVTTSSPDYYKWTQWLFTQMFKAGLAYKKKASVNFCPSCKTVLADEQVMAPAQAGKTPKDKSGKEISDESTWDELKVCERCGTIVEKKELDQWFMRITDYADKLLAGLDKIDWSKKVVLAQREWIGKKDGAEIYYDIENSDEKIVVFTTAPVNFGMTFLALSPVHEIVTKILMGKVKVDKKYLPEIKKYVETYARLQGSPIKTKEKTGVPTGLNVINPINNKPVPIWISDFVMADVGTGAVQGCPGHDKRDFQFAKKFGLPVMRVIIGEDGYDGPIEEESQVIEHGMKGTFVNSEFLNGLEFEEGLQKTIDWFEERAMGKRHSAYHLRDWLVSRQRYWGAPIPMIHCKSCEERGEGYLNNRSIQPQSNAMGSVQGETLHILHEDHSDWDYFGWWPVPDEDLPVLLPSISDYKPEGAGKGPLANHPDFYEVKCPHCGSEAVRETDVLDTFVDSSWYFLRYPSSDIEKVAFDPVITKKWLPVNLYFGGAEHSVLHLMYARFVTKVLHDLEFLDFDEPFPKFFAHGLMIKDGAKMSKSRGNVVNPDEYIKKFGADVLRLYVMFIGPMDASPDFRDTGIEGMERFVKRVWKLFSENKDLVLENEKDGKKLQSKLHRTIKKVTEEVSNFKYNTAIASLMELVNFLYQAIGDRQQSLESEKLVPSAKSLVPKVHCSEWNEALKNLCLMLAPFAPHFTEEVWVEILGQPFSVHKQEWPKYVSELIKEDHVTIIIQVNGKIRSQFTVNSSQSTDEKYLTKLAREDQNASKWLDGHEIKKAIFIPGKLVNFVV